MLQTILGTILVLFIPGFALTLALFPRKEIDLAERIGFAVILSISVNVISVFALNYFMNLEITRASILLNILFWTLLFSMVYLFRIRGQQFRFDLNFKPEREDVLKGLKALAVIAVLAFVFNQVYGVHRDYAYPYHSDEWYHIAHGVQIMDKNGIESTEPYFKYGKSYRDLEIGFHVFLAEFFLLTGKDPVLFYKFLPAMFACISAFILFVFIYRTIDFYAGIFAVLFFASLKTTITVLGLWFFVPLTMCFPLIYGFFYLISEGVRRNNLLFLILSVVTITTIALIHPQSASWIYPVIILYLIFLSLLFLIRTLRLRLNVKEIWGEIVKIKKSIAGIALLFSLPFLSFFYFFKLMWKGSFEKTLEYFTTEFIFFGEHLENKLIYEPSYLMDFYGFSVGQCAGWSCMFYNIGILLALIGVVYCILTKRLILVAWICVMIASIAVFQMPELGEAVKDFLDSPREPPFTILAMYERYIYYTLICLAPLSGIGLFAVLKVVYGSISFVSKKINVEISGTKEKIIFAPIALLLIYFIFSGTFSGYYEDKTKLYKLIDDNDYMAIKWLKENKGSHNVVMARPQTSSAIYPASKNYVVSMSLQEHSTRESSNDERVFFSADCKKKKEILDKYEVDYVLVKFRIRCRGLEQIYGEDKRYIYETV